MSLVVAYKTNDDPLCGVEKRPFGKLGENIAAHRHYNFYEIEVLVSGKCKYKINETEYSAKTGSCFLTTPFDVHSVDVLGGEPIIYNLWFSESLVLTEYQNILFNTNIHCIDFQNPQKLFTLLDLLLDEINAKADHFSGESQRELLNLIIAEVIRNAKIPDAKEKSELVSDIARYIRIHLSEDITLESVSKSFNISPPHLSRMFKKAMGTNFKRYIIDLRMSWARTLLASTEMPITTVCYETGFSGVGSFLRRFKDENGMTPSAYRKAAKAAQKSLSKADGL